MNTPFFTLRVNVIACATACAGLYGSHALAQPITPATLPEVIVTANRMEQALQTAPMGATIILGEDIRAAGLLDANEAMRKLGGVAARSDLTGGREASLDIRGYGDSASNNTVVMVDGIRISENEQASARLSAISPDMIERIEIIRGGASVIWGEGATGGVINIISKAGKQLGFSGSASLGLDSFRGNDKRANLNLNGEQVKVFVQARAYKTDGYRANSGNSNEAVNFGVEAGSEDGFKARLSLFSDNLESRLAGSLPIATALVNPSKTNTPLDRSTQQEERDVLALQYRTGGLTLALDLAHRDRSSTYFADYGSFGDQSNTSTGSSTQISPRVSYTAQLGNAVLSTVFGVERSNWDYNKKTSYSGYLSNHEIATQTNTASYLKADLLLASQTRLVAGLRKERITAHYDDALASSPTAFAQNTPMTAWELGANQTIFTGLDAYARSASSFRVANVDDNRYLAVGAALRPQTARDIELGLKYSKAGSSYGIRAFQQDTRDEIAYDNTAFANVNLNAIRRKGVELEARTQLARGLGLSANVQALSAQFANGANVGKTPPHISKLNANVRLDYAFSSAHNAALSVVKRSSAALGNDFSNSCGQKIPARTTLDALYRYHSSNEAGWILSAGIDNLSNVKSYSWAFTNAACSAINVYPEAGRSFKISAKYLF